MECRQRIVFVFLAIAFVIAMASSFQGKSGGDCDAPVRHNPCGREFECGLSHGHSGSHVAAEHKCPRERKCPSCSNVTVKCNQKCGHSGYTHGYIPPHDCKRMGRCPRCYFEERCIYGNCGHGNFHPVSHHPCRRPADCPNCNYQKCKFDCGHSGMHKVKSHGCAVRGKCMLCKTELKCLNNKCGHGDIHLGACPMCKKAMPLKVE